MGTDAAVPAVARFGDLLRRYRGQAGLTQEALAERAGLSVRGISDLERGVKRAPRRDTLRLLADALNLGLPERAAFATAARPASAGNAPRAAVPDLPIPPTPLVGRDAEVAAVGGRLRDGETRLLTLTGPGGVGKTRLALRVAAELAPDFPDGVVFVPLASIADPGLVPAAVARRLGVRETAGHPAADAIREHLRTRHPLLVLDNFEHLRPAAALVPELLATCPELTVLVTSRAPLRVRGEQQYPVPPLRLPDPRRLSSLPELAGVEAVALFLQQARAVDPAFVLTEANAATIAEICARLDGLPLAIELAAARLPALSPSALLALLSNRLRLLAGGLEDAPARQRTMAAAIAWSHDLLDAAGKTLFRRLAVFAGGCTLEAVATVVDDGDPFAALDGLSALVEQSLLRRVESESGESRFVMLETVRDYAREQLAASDDEEAIRRRHAEYFLALAETARPGSGPEQAVWLDRLETEHGNLRAALGWTLAGANDVERSEMALRMAVALWRFWDARGHVRESRDWLERALARGEHAAPGLRADALLMLANTAQNLDDHGQAQAHYVASMILYQQADNAAGVAWALVGQALLATSRGDYNRARTLYEESMERWLRLDNLRGLVVTIHGLGQLEIALGNYKRGKGLFEQAVNVCEQLGDDDWKAAAYLELARLARYQDDASAQSLAEASLAILEDVGDKRGAAMVLCELARLAGKRRDLQQSATLYGEALILHREVGHQIGMVECIEGLGGLILEWGMVEQAARLIAAASAWRETTGSALPPPDREAVDRTVAAARAVLGAEGIRSLWEAGKSDTLDQAVAIALHIARGASAASEGDALDQPAGGLHRARRAGVD